MLKQMPRLGWILGFCAMASLGLPGLAGFWGEFPAILSTYSPAPGLSVELYRTLMVISAVGTVLAASYLLWLYQRTAFGEPTAEFSGGGHHAHAAGAAVNAEHDDEIVDVKPLEWLAWTPLLLGILLLGVYPQLLFKVMDPAVSGLAAVFGK
jgi:NADH-quinone oxidoreductase subunit M